MTRKLNEVRLDIWRGKATGISRPFRRNILALAIERYRISLIVNILHIALVGSVCQGEGRGVSGKPQIAYVMVTQLLLNHSDSMIGIPHITLAETGSYQFTAT